MGWNVAVKGIAPLENRYSSCYAFFHGKKQRTDGGTIRHSERGMSSNCLQVDSARSAVQAQKHGKSLAPVCQID